MTYSFYLNILDVKILITSPYNYVKKFFLISPIPEVFLPEYEISSNSSMYDLSVTILEKLTRKVDFKKNKLIICDTWDGVVPTYFLRLIYSTLLYILHKKGIFSIHASCISNKNSIAILSGFARDGKTTLALKFLENNNFKLISNNKCFITIEESFKVLSGTKTLSIRENDIPEYLKDEIVTYDTRYGRNFLKLSQNLIDSFPKNKVVKLFYVRVNSGVTEFYKMSKEEATIYLYPKLLDIVDYDTLLFDLKIPAPISFPDYEIKKNLAINLDSFLEKNHIYFVSGSFEFIYDKINKIIEE